MPNAFWNIHSIIEQMEIKVVFKLKSVSFDILLQGWFWANFQYKLSKYLRCVNMNTKMQWKVIKHMENILGLNLLELN